MAEETKGETETPENTDEEADESEDSEDESKKKDEPSQVDYEAELKLERLAREKAEKALADKAFRGREEKRKEKDEEEEEAEKPLTARELEVILARERQETERKLRSSQIETLARAMAGSEAEAQLIVEIHKNRAFPEHYTLEDALEESYVIANRKKIIGENSELKRALRSRGAVNRDGASAHQDAPKGTEAKLAPADAAAIAAVGFVWNGTTRRYEKKLRNGDILYRDPKTKETKIQKK